MRCQRSSRRPRVKAASGTSVLAVSIGWIDATPIITASRMTSSILSPLSTACASVTRTRHSGTGTTGSPTSTTTPVLSTEVTLASASRPWPSKIRTAAPACTRRTRRRCPASSAGSATVRSRGSSDGTYRRGTMRQL